MELTQLERDLLAMLANEWETTGPPGYLETKILAHRLGISLGQTKSMVHSLFVKGLVDTDEKEHYAAFLTPDGYEKARC